MVTILINDFPGNDIDDQRIKELAEFTLKYLKKDESEITIVFVSNEIITRMNKKYRKNDYSTDVLSFNLDFTNNETNLNYLGDVVVSYDKAKEQAAQLGHSFETETHNLIVHGILHLAGYEDEYEQDQIIMLQTQKEIIHTFSKIGNDE